MQLIASNYCTVYTRIFVLHAILRTKNENCVLNCAIDAPEVWKDYPSGPLFQNCGEEKIKVGSDRKFFATRQFFQRDRRLEWCLGWVGWEWMDPFTENQRSESDRHKFNVRIVSFFGSDCWWKRIEYKQMQPARKLIKMRWVMTQVLKRNQQQLVITMITWLMTKLKKK